MEEGITLDMKKKPNNFRGPTFREARIIVGMFLLAAVIACLILQDRNSKIIELKDKVKVLETQLAAQHKQKAVVEKETVIIPEVKYEPDAETRAEDLERYIKTRYPGVAPEIAEVIASKADTLCAEADLPFTLVVGLMEVESRFNPFAKSSVGARGLLQVMPLWLKQLKLTDVRQLHGIEEGIRGGLFVLTHYIKTNKGNITKALQNYNGTKGNDFHESVYEKAGRFSIFCETLRNEQHLEAENKDDTKPEKAVAQISSPKKTAQAAVKEKQKS